jgi:hypothetical protein
MMTALAGAFSIGLATAALAVTGEFDNMCAEGLALHKIARSTAASKARPTASVASRRRLTS